MPETENAAGTGVGLSHPEIAAYALKFLAERNAHFSDRKTENLTKTFAGMAEGGRAKVEKQSIR